MDSLSFNRNKYVFTSVPAMLLIGECADNNRNRQISLFLQELTSYNVILKDLVNYQPKEETRNVILNIAYYIMENEKLSEKFIRKKQLPIKQLSMLTRINTNYLNDWKDYIISYYIILTNPNYKVIQDHLKIILKEKNKVVSLVNKKYTLHKGIVLKSLKKTAYILTSTGQFLKIKTGSKVKVGEMCEGKECTRIGKYKLHISILLIILIFISSATIIDYRKTKSIVVIEASSIIKIHVNKFDKVIYTYSPTERGKELLSSIDIENEDVDNSIARIFEYGLEKNMIDKNKKTLITITGEPMKYGELKETNKIISEKKIPIIINNSGTQQKLPEYIPEN